MTLATCFASQTANNMSTVFFTRDNLITPVFVNNNHQSDTMASPTPRNTTRSPTENPENGRKGKRVSAFFKRVWKAAKRPFLSSDRSRVVPFEPQSDNDNFEHLPVPGPSRTVAAHADLEPVWLPGQVCEDPQPLSVPGPSKIKQTADVPNADRARPESSTALTGHVDPEQMHPPVQVCDSLESLAVPGPSRIQSTTIADHVDPEQMRPPVQVCEDPQPLSVPGPSRIKQTADVSNADWARPESSTALTGHVDTEQMRSPVQVCDSLESLAVPGPSRIQSTTIADHVDPEQMRPPVQVCEDPQPGPSNIKKMTDADSVSPESPPSVQDPSKIDGTDEKPKKGRKGKRVSAFFKRVWKAAKFPFLHFTPQPEPESEPDPDLESVFLPGQGPEEDSGLTRGFDLSQFEVGDMIGEGAFGQVYVASHKRSKRVKVALKCMVKSQQDRYLDVDGHSTPVLAEVAMMLRLMNAPRCPNIIRLHHWLEIEDNFVLILEYAESCKTLLQYIKDTADIEENQARQLMRQLIRAVMFCTERGVFHGDIHTANILVTLPRLELKLIDFGCAQPITQKPFNKSDYRGAGHGMPPEALRCRVFHAYPAYVWTIGIMLYEIMHGRLAFNNRQSIMFGCIEIHPRLSTACVDLISQCLIRNPAKRLQLHQVEEHCWFNPTTPNPVKQLYNRRKN
ncbi:si:dkey-80c24.1 isoform X1 [Danio rerio]|uniref:non-specific serine/threonine protein kinase n=2 Tax=Danio rerio TaxID=7955 RepID=A0AB32TJF7_DANRE